MKTVLELIEYMRLPQEMIADRANRPNIHQILTSLENGKVELAGKQYEYFQDQRILFFTPDEVRKRRNRIHNLKAKRKYGNNWNSKRPRYVAKLKIKQNNQCVGCGREFGKELLPEVDHIVRIADGGHHGLANMQLLCQFCHDAKDNYKPGMISNGISDVLIPVMSIYKGIQHL